MFDVVTIGDAVSDIFIRPSELSVTCPMGRIRGKTCFEPVICLPYGDKIPISEIHYDIGGSAANVAVGLSRLGFNTGFIGAVGKDQNGQKIISRLEKEGVKTKWVKQGKDVQTNFSLIISYKGERTILVYRGLEDYSQLELPKVLNTKWLYVGPLGEGFEKLYSAIISKVAEKNIKLSLNPGTLQIESKAELKRILRVAEIVFVNKEEAEEIVGLSRPALVKDLLKALKQYGAKVVVITDGAEGAYSFDGEEFLHISAYQAKRKEVTGAGDAFSTGCLGALVLGKDVREGLRWGVINSASVIEKNGAESGLLNISQIERRLNRAPNPRAL